MSGSTQVESIGVSRQPLLLVALGLLLALLAVGGYKAQQWLAPPQAVELAFDPACDLRAGPCALDVPGGGRVVFSIEPRTLPVLQPLTLRVEAPGLGADAVVVDFAGVDMNMGLNRFELEPTGDGVFSGTGLLPVCIRNRMLWQATVYAEADRGLIAAPFRFETVRQRE